MSRTATSAPTRKTPVRRLVVAMRRRAIPTVNATPRSPTQVDRYWGDHTVRSDPFNSARESEDYLQWRSDQYPMFPELMDIWGNHRGEVVLDYGCGPANDLLGYLLYSGARRVIGIDVSPKALSLARRRLSLHPINPRRVRLIQTGDASTEIPLDDASVDYINCGGVLHHTSDPGSILREFRRILRPGRKACVMVYNWYSVFVHLYIAYMRMLLSDEYPGMDVYEVFTRSTDGPDCPISRPYKPDEFIALGESAGLRTEFAGGYLALSELTWLDDHGAAAIADERLPDEHRQFLRDLGRDERGLAIYRGKYAGIGGVYNLYKD